MENNHCCTLLHVPGQYAPLHVADSAHECIWMSVPFFLHHQSVQQDMILRIVPGPMHPGKHSMLLSCTPTHLAAPHWPDSTRPCPPKASNPHHPAPAPAASDADAVQARQPPAPAPAPQPHDQTADPPPDPSALVAWACCSLAPASMMLPPPLTWRAQTALLPVTPCARPGRRLWL